MTFFSGESLPVFVLTIYEKSAKDDLTNAERQALRKLTTDLIESYGRGRRAG